MGLLHIMVLFSAECRDGGEALLHTPYVTSMILEQGVFPSIMPAMFIAATLI